MTSSAPVPAIRACALRWNLDCDYDAAKAKGYNHAVGGVADGYHLETTSPCFRIASALTSRGVSAFQQKLCNLTLNPEPVLHRQLEPGNLVIVQLAAVGDGIPNLVELREDQLHRFLAP